ncbi:hypothetical protein T439DRAFT_328614 [Meredithblackwellia eburnea MCA 4105]
MDFLTAPLIAYRPATQPAPPAPASSGTPTSISPTSILPTSQDETHHLTTTEEQQSDTTTTTNSKPQHQQDTSSLHTVSTDDIDNVVADEVEEANARFAQLRTTCVGPRRGEKSLEGPSLKRGDWRAFSQVECRVVVWQDGHLRRGAKPSSDEQEWVLAPGTLWVTKNNEIIFIVDTNVPPKNEPCLTVGRKSRKPSAFNFVRRLSSSSPQTKDDKTLGADTSPSTTQERRKSLSSFFNRKGDKDKDAEENTTGDQVEGEGKDKGSIIGFVKGLFGKGDSAVDEDEDGNALGLSRTRSRSLTLNRTRSLSRSRTTEIPVGPIRASPLPSYDGHTITALRVPSPATSIHSIRLLPSRRGGGGGSLPASPPLSRSVSRDGEQLPRGGGGGGGGVENLLPPRVEVDLMAPLVDRENPTAKDENGRERECTVAFAFVEPLMEQEAQMFLERLEDIAVPKKK